MTRYLSAAVLLLVGQAAIADDGARKVVDRAIDAVGGAKKLADLTGGVWRTVGTFQGRPSRADFSGQLPDKFRTDSTRLAEGKKTRYSRIVNGEKGWVIDGDQVRPMTAAEIADVRSSYYHKQAVTTLIPLTENAVRLSLAGKATHEGRPVTQVKAAREGYPDLLLSFDDRTGLLVRSEMTVKSERTGKPRKVVLELSGHKEFGGIKLPGRTRTYHDGELFLDTETVEFKAASNLPQKTFTPDGGK